MELKRWYIDERVDNEPMIFLSQTWSEEKMELLFCSYSSEYYVKVIFLNEIDAVEIKHLDATLLSEESTAKLMKAVDCVGPLNPFFIQISTNPVIVAEPLQIDSELADLYYQAHINQGSTLQKYIMCTANVWINVSSYKPPAVEVIRTEGAAD